MEELTFNNELYTKMSSNILMNCTGIFDIIDNMYLGEYCEYGDKYLFKTDNGMIASYKEDLSNYWYI